ncbi:hypothetical protein FB45DRAFT_707622, partial [Roridomyces roridus]
GTKYSDLVHIYGLARAGFVPEVLNTKMTIQVIRDLLLKTGGKALIFELSFAGFVSANSSVSCVSIPEFSLLSTFEISSLPPLPDVEPTDIALIFHT